MRVIEWDPEDVPAYSKGHEGPCIKAHYDLTEIHGEREYLRHGFLVDVDGDGELELITRTMNANRARAIRTDDASTVWISPDIVSYPASTQISDMAVGDLDEDGNPEVLLASYEGDVICLDATDGSLKWHRKLDWLINNSMLKASKITPGPGKSIALTVGQTDRRTGGSRPRVNYLPNPSLLVLDSAGDEEIFVENYAADNSSGHYTWTYDIDNDGFCEIACCGHQELVWFDNDGSRLFVCPSEGEGGHPDDVLAYNWEPTLPGREIIYLNGTIGVRIFSCDGKPMKEADLSEFSSHLQLLMVVPRDNEPALVGCNIRARDSKLLFMDHDLSVEWALQLPPDLLPPALIDWSGDGRWEIAAGGFGRGADNQGHVNECSMQVMTQDGAPLLWHRWDGCGQATILDIADIDADGNPEMVVSVGSKDGPEGRWSLPDGAHEHLYIIGPAE
ncbi:MAG: VCBS repeat-containing protein [Armatimonadota bacterium]